MAPLNPFSGKGSKALQAQPLKVRKQTVATKGVQKPLRSTSSTPERSLVQSRKAHLAPPTKSQSARSRSPTPRKRAASVQARVESDSEEETPNGECEQSRRKRVRLSTDPEPDSKRRIRETEAFAERSNGHFTMVHAADIASSNKSAKFKRAFSDCPDELFISLQYPSALQVERLVFRCRLLASCLLTSLGTSL